MTDVGPGMYCMDADSHACHYTSTVSQDIREAARPAVCAMISLLETDRDIERTEAYMLFCVAGDLRMHEVVRPASPPTARTFLTSMMFVMLSRPAMPNYVARLLFPVAPLRPGVCLRFREPIT